MAYFVGYIPLYPLPKYPLPKGEGGVRGYRLSRDLIPSPQPCPRWEREFRRAVVEVRILSNGLHQ